MTCKDKKRRPHSSSKTSYCLMTKKNSVPRRRSPRFACRPLFKSSKTKPLFSLLFSLFLFIVVFAASVAVSTLIKITVSPANKQSDQVFLNFKGELRNNFVSHLTEALERNEINFFIYKNEHRGNDLRNLFLRIQQSNLALAIFSPRYPESEWCMNELVKMKELADRGKLIVIPIFYKVKATDVRNPTIESEFGRNFWRLMEVSNINQIKKWKEALEYITDKMGLSLGDDSSEADFVKEIVQEVKRVIEART